MKIKMKIKRNSYFFGKILFVVLIFIAVMAICNNIIALNEQNEKIAQLEETKNTLRIKEEELQRLIDEPMDNDYIERIAREKFDYRKPYGTIFCNGLYD